MKLRYAAALPLLGWYLMVPPWSSPGHFNDNAPLRKWHQVGAYDSASECEQDMVRTVQHFQRDKALNSATANFNAAIYAAGQCIATDDPRLKSN